MTALAEVVAEVSAVIDVVDDHLAAATTWLALVAAKPGDAAVDAEDSIEEAQRELADLVVRVRHVLWLDGLAVPR